MALIVTGVPGLLKDLANRAAVLDRTGARRIFRDGAKIIAEQARQNAPRGRASVEPGRLKRSIIWFLGRNRGRAGQRQVDSFARVNVKSGRVQARHGLILEAGRGPVIPKKKKILKFNSVRSVIFALRVRAVAAHPYFEPAVVSAGPRALDMIVEKLKTLLGEAA